MKTRPPKKSNPCYSTGMLDLLTLTIHIQNIVDAKVAYETISTTKDAKRFPLMCHAESSLISHMMTLRNAAEFFGVGILAFTLELALGLEDCGDVFDGALMELFEGCTRNSLAAGVARQE